MTWADIGNISSIITCITFALYIGGRIWTIHVNKNRLLAELKFEEPADEEGKDCIDLAGEYGAVFSVSSPKGIRVMNLYSTQTTSHSKEPFRKGKRIKRIENISPNEKVYIRAEFFDTGSNLYLEIKRADYINTSFLVADSGKDGSFVQANIKHRMTLMSWLYYLCTDR